MQFDQQCFKTLHYILFPFLLSHTNGVVLDLAPKLTVFVLSVYSFITFNMNLDKTIADILNSFWHRLAELGKKNNNKKT